MRKMTNDGLIHLRHLNPDGTEICDTMTPAGALWHRGFRMGNQTQVQRYSAIQNLVHLSNADPFLFEEVLCFLENSTSAEASIMADRLHYKQLSPSLGDTDNDDVQVYRQLLQAIPFIAVLVGGATSSALTVQAVRLLNTATKCVGTLGSPLLTAAVLGVWIMKKTKGKQYRLPYETHRADLEFIDAHRDEVMKHRRRLAQVGSIDRELITELMEVTTPLSAGVL